MFYLIYLMLIGLVFVGGIMGEHYKYSICALGLFVLAIMFPLNSSAYAEAFGCLFFGLIVFVVSLVGGFVLIGGAEVIKNRWIGHKILFN